MVRVAWPRLGGQYISISKLLSLLAVFLFKKNRIGFLCYWQIHIIMYVQYIIVRNILIWENLYLKNCPFWTVLGHLSLHIFSLKSVSIQSGPDLRNNLNPWYISEQITFGAGPVWCNADITFRINNYDTIHILHLSNSLKPIILRPSSLFVICFIFMPWTASGCCKH